MPFKVASTLGDIAAAAIAIVSANVNHTQSLYILKELLAWVCFQPRPWLSGAGLSGLRFLPYVRVVEMKLLIFSIWTECKSLFPWCCKTVSVRLRRKFTRCTERWAASSSCPQNSGSNLESHLCKDHIRIQWCIKVRFLTLKHNTFLNILSRIFKKALVAHLQHHSAS